MTPWEKIAGQIKAIAEGPIYGLSPLRAFYFTWKDKSVVEQAIKDARALMETHDACPNEAT